MIIRRRHTANFTTIGNVLFEDDRLEADEVGVLAYLLSRPNDWEVRRPALQRRWRIGRDSIKRIITNCMCAGWIVAKRTRLSNGTFHTIYEVRDQPGPTLTLEEVKAALSLVSSDADDSEHVDGPTTDHPPDSGPPPTPQPGVADQLRQTRRGSSIEDSLNTDSEKPESPNRGREFADVLSAWPLDHVLSAVTAEASFTSLNEADREFCFAGINPYLADCKAQNRKVCDLTTFIRERRWERFVRGQPGKQLWNANPYTPQWHRWRDYKIAMGESVAFMETQARQGRGITTQSEWPPAIAKAAS